MSAAKILIDKDLTVDGVSDPFTIERQATVVALGLEPGDVVTLWLVLITDPIKGECTCPPMSVILPTTLDEVQLKCCGTPIELTRDNPFVVLDAPQGVKIRAKLNASVTNAVPLSTQRVTVQETTSNHLCLNCGS